MEITDDLSKNEVFEVIRDDFDEIGREYQNPISPYKINLKGSGKNLTFCNIPSYD